MTGCPKCGSLLGYKIKVRATGYTVHAGQWDVDGGNEQIMDDSNLRLIADKTVRCLSCGARSLLKTLRAA